MKNLYLTNRFFWWLGGMAAFSALTFVWQPLFPLAVVLLIGFGLIFLTDVSLLFGTRVQIAAHRKLPPIWGLADETEVKLELCNQSMLFLYATIIEELPLQMQLRDFEKKLSLPVGEWQTLCYSLQPVERGSYLFGATNVFVSTRLRLAERRIIFRENNAEVAVYPSVMQMKKMERLASRQLGTQGGIRKIRRLGHSYEFEQIKEYVRGDDYRSINWKASGRKGQLMVNQYEDERAQQVYCIIDKSRPMHFAFEGMRLLDYAINTSLALSNTVLRKHDKAGLLTFSDKLGSVLQADNKPTQLNTLLQLLYKETVRPVEADFDLLYTAVRQFVRVRSLLLLFTNFESIYAMERILPVLRKLQHLHLLVVIVFENTAIAQFAEAEVPNLEGIYEQTAARKYLSEKQQMVKKLRQLGIQVVFTQPERLSLDAINKYLELKLRGSI